MSSISRLCESNSKLIIGKHELPPIANSNPRPTISSGLQDNLSKINKTLGDLVRANTHTGWHFGVLASLIVSIGVGSLTILLFRRQGKTMHEQTSLQSKQIEIMQTQSTISKQLISIEESRENQGNYVYAYVKGEVNPKAFEGSEEKEVPYEEAITFKLVVVNDSKLPIRDVWVLFRPVIKQIEIKPDELLIESTSERGPEIAQSTKKTKTVLTDVEDHAKNTRLMIFGVIAPHTRKTYLVDPKCIREMNYLFPPSKLFKKQSIEFGMGAADGQFAAAVRFRDAKGHDLARDFDGRLLHGIEILAEIPEYRLIVGNLPGKHLDS